MTKTVIRKVRGDISSTARQRIEGERPRQSGVKNGASRQDIMPAPLMCFTIFRLKLENKGW